MNTSPVRAMLIAGARTLIFLTIYAAISTNDTGAVLIGLGIAVWTIAEHFPL